MWSNDYPHSACIWPGATRFIAQDLGHLAPEARAKVLCGNAARLYNDGSYATGRHAGERERSGGMEQGPLARVGALKSSVDERLVQLFPAAGSGSGAYCSSCDRRLAQPRHDASGDNCFPDARMFQRAWTPRRSGH